MSLPSLPPKSLAEQIIRNLAEYGTPISRGVGYYNVGTDSILSALEKHYLDAYLRNGGAAFKLVVGDYGSGKSHFLYCLRERAWSHRFVVSKVELSPRECPYEDQKKVYIATAKALMWQNPDGDDEGAIKGLASLLRHTLEEIVLSHGVPLGSAEAAELPEVKTLLQSLRNTPIDNTSYRYAVMHFLEAVLHGDAELQEMLGLWLHGEELSVAARKDLRQFGVSDKLSASNAFQMLRSLSQTIRALGFSGVCLLFDEMDRQISLSSRSAIGKIIDNLREVVDRTREDLPGTLFVYAVLPEFVTEIVPKYPALQQRLQAYVGNYFSSINPFSSQINLDQLDIDDQTLLVRIAERLRGIFEVAYETRLDPQIQAQNAQRLAEAALRFLTGTSHRRIFIKALVSEWYRQNHTGERLLSADEAENIIGVSLSTDIS